MEDKGRILDAITCPQDLHVLSNEELEILSSELREEIISVTSQVGGHVASSLGAVEMIVALHSMLDCPKDRIVFDVGHQAYAHKLLTGRLDEFGTIRQHGGLSGFPNPQESVYDVHPSGHASDSLSVAMGLAKARDLNASDEKIVAVIGDAAIAGGMAFEALNHIGQEQTPMVIVLNDNEMSISHPVGALVRHLGLMRTADSYRTTRDRVQGKMEEGGPMTRSMLDLGRSMKDSFKQFILPQSMIFENFGIVCTPPIDGHDIASLRSYLQMVLESNAPVLMHVVTRKGEGYAPAQENPELFHGVGPYDRETGVPVKKPATVPTYTAVFGDAIVAEAESDDSIVAITAAMEGGTGLGAFARKFPDRFFDTGITEEHALGFAAGLSFGGKKPVVAIYSTFLQRALDQVIIDNALPQTNVVMCIDRGGIVGADGSTHMGAFDISYLRMIPNVSILTPSNEAELVDALHTALQLEGPVALRYPRGSAEGVDLPEEPSVMEFGKSRCVREGDDIAILAFGRMVGQALGAADILFDQGINARVVDMRWAKPLDASAILEATATGLVVTVEEGVIPGGAGEGVLEAMSECGAATPSLVLGLPDAFIKHGDVSKILHELGLDAQGIAASITEKLSSIR